MDNNDGEKADTNNKQDIWSIEACIKIEYNLQLFSKKLYYYQLYTTFNMHCQFFIPLPATEHSLKDILTDLSLTEIDECLPRDGESNCLCKR